MLPLPSRHRPLVLLACVVLAQVLLLAVQIRRERDVRLIRVWAVWVVTPFQRGGVAVIDKISNTWTGYVDLRHTRSENEKLRAEVSELKLRVSQLESGAAEAQRLSALLAFREAHPAAPMLAARVIGTSPVAGNHTVYIDRGAQDKVEKNMGVVTPEGVVGKVLEVYDKTAQVLLVTDKDSGVGALLATSRTTGVVRGAGEASLWMHYVINDEEVPLNERVLTSGQDRIFPKDLPIGTVAEVRSGSPFKQIRVRPAARLDRLEEVLILLSRQELETPPEKKAP
jgi:rod shape-determining protein MreC